MKEVEAYLTGHYRVKGVWRFPEPEYQAFKQVVVLATRREEPGPPSSLEVFGVLPSYALTSLRVPESYGILQRGEVLQEAEILEALERSHLFQEEKMGLVRPLLPLKNAHLALLLAGGLMDNQVVFLEDKPYLVRGEVRKVKVKRWEEEEGCTREIDQEQFQVQVVALGLLDGRILEVT